MNTPPIEYCQLGRTPFRVSRLCIGSLQGAALSPERNKAFIRAVHVALEAGINFIDTAEGYGNGHAEKLLAQAINGRRQNVILASKFSHNHCAPSKLRRSLEGTLRRFQTDYLDIYQQHWPPTTPPLEETIATLQILKREGKIRAVGACNWMEPEFAEIGRPQEIDVLQNCYNLLWRGVEREVLPRCRELGIAFLSYSPLCQGVLAERDSLDDPLGIRQANRFAKREDAEALRPLRDTLQSIAKKHGRTSAQVALRWILEKPVDAIIVGNSTPEQTLENLGAFGWNLSSAEVALLDSISAVHSAQMRPHDTLWRWHSREGRQ